MPNSLQVKAQSVEIDERDPSEVAHNNLIDALLEKCGPNYNTVELTDSSERQHQVTELYVVHEPYQTNYFIDGEGICIED